MLKGNGPQNSEKHRALLSSRQGQRWMNSRRKQPFVWPPPASDGVDSPSGTTQLEEKFRNLRLKRTVCSYSEMSFCHFKENISEQDCLDLFLAEWTKSVNCEPITHLKSLTSFREDHCPLKKNSKKNFSRTQIRFGLFSFQGLHYVKSHIISVCM